MLDVLLRPARDRGIAALLARLLPSGSMGPDVDDAGAYHMVPAAFALCGQLGAAHRVLNHVEQRYLPSDGEVRTREGLRSVMSSHEESASSLNAGLVLGAVLSGRSGLAQRFGRHLAALRAGAPEVCIGGSLTHGPVAGLGSDGVTDVGSTVQAGLADLSLGNVAEALLAARFLRRVWDAQPHPDALLLRRDASGSLVTLWPASASPLHCVHAAGPGTGHGVLGQWIKLCVRLHEAGNGDVADGLPMARQVLRFAQRCVPHVTLAADAVELAAGAVLLGESEGNDLATLLLRRALGSQDGDGTFGTPEFSPVERLEHTARTVFALQELMAAVGEVDVPPLATQVGGLRLVLCNVPVSHARSIADAVVEERLAACVNAIPAVLSTYEWKGKIERENEVTLLLKTTAERIPLLTSRLCALHPYEVPEVIVVPLNEREGNAAYLDWIRAQVQPLA